MKKVAFVGSKALGAKVLEKMYQLAPDSLSVIISIDDSLDTRSTLSSYAQFAQKTGKPLRVLKKSAQLPEVIAEFEPDLCIVVGWYWVLKPELLKMVSEGWLGIHASLLPKYRGGAPLVWAIINGETESGLSLFYFDDGMDTGDIVAQRKFVIGPKETIADVLHKAEALSTEIIQDTYPILINGILQQTTQNHSQATYGAIRKPADGRIDWHLSAIQLYNFIRAQTHPYPGAFCLTPTDKTLRIWQAKVFPYPYFGNPGQVVMLENDEVVVTCGHNSALRLSTIQLDGQAEQEAITLLKFGQRLQ